MRLKYTYKKTIAIIGLLLGINTVLFASDALASSQAGRIPIFVFVQKD